MWAHCALIGKADRTGGAVSGAAHELKDYPLIERRAWELLEACGLLGAAAAGAQALREKLKEVALELAIPEGLLGREVERAVAAQQQLEQQLAQLQAAGGDDVQQAILIGAPIRGLIRHMRALEVACELLRTTERLERARLRVQRAALAAGREGGSQGRGGRRALQESWRQEAQRWARLGEESGVWKAPLFLLLKEVYRAHGGTRAIPWHWRAQEPDPPEVAEERFASMAWVLSGYLGSEEFVREPAAKLAALSDPAVRGRRG